MIFRLLGHMSTLSSFGLINRKGELVFSDGRHSGVVIQYIVLYVSHSPPLPLMSFVGLLNSTM